MTKRLGKLVLTGMKGQGQHEERKVIKEVNIWIIKLMLSNLRGHYLRNRKHVSCSYRLIEQGQHEERKAIEEINIWIIKLMFSNVRESYLRNRNVYRVSIDLLEMTKRKGKLDLTGMKG